jgi:hypothetical protein
LLSFITFLCSTFSDSLKLIHTYSSFQSHLFQLIAMDCWRYLLASTGPKFKLQYQQQQKNYCNGIWGLSLFVFHYFMYRFLSQRKITNFWASEVKSSLNLVARKQNLQFVASPNQSSLAGFWMYHTVWVLGF